MAREGRDVDARPRQHFTFGASTHSPPTIFALVSPFNSAFTLHGNLLTSFPLHFPSPLFRRASSILPCVPAMSFLGLNLFRRSGAITTPTTAPIENDEVEEGLDIAISFLGTGTEVEERLNSPSIITTALEAATPQSHKENDSSPRKPSSSLRKVTFESLKECDYHYSSSPSRVLSPLRLLPQSREQPAKSILKPFQASSLNTVTPRTFGSFQEMVDNAVRQLAAGDQKSRIDAYQSFLNAVQTKISAPEQDALLDATTSLLEFVYRDVQNASSQNLQIVTWALKFLATLTRMIPVAEQPEFDGLSSLLDFAITFIETAVDKAIKENTVVEKAGIPKVVIHHHLLYLCQRFNPKILTPERAARVLTCLSKIHDRVQGNNVKVYRLIIYQQLFEAIPNTMISRASDWLPNLFNCLLSNKAEVRQHAMNLGLTASLRHARQLCKSVEDILSSKNEETRFMDLFIEQLAKLLEHKDREMALIVPRVWATMVLFLRPRFKKPEFWSWFKPWLTLLSQAMNSSDRQVKLETYVAWKRFIFAVMPDKQTISQVRRMLRSPFQDALLNQRELQQGPGRTMMSGYLCLLYYALRPGATFEDLDIYWTEYVSPILVNFTSVKRNGQHLYCASSIVQSLFQSSEKWDENRANSPQAFEIDELPRLDCNWIRSRLDKALVVVEPILLHPTSWAPIDDENKIQERPLDSDNLALSTWSSLMDAVREAGAKEITISAALKSSVAATTNALHKVGKWLVQNPPSSINSAQAFQLMTECAITRLGPSSFTERMLMKNPESQDFEIAPTPSHRSNPGSLQSPITHLLALQIQLCSNSECGLELTKSVELIQSLVEQCWNSLSLRTSKLNLIADLLETLESEYGKDSSLPQLVSETSDHLLELAEEITRPTLNGLVASTLSAKDFEAILAISKYFIAISGRGNVPKVLYEHATGAAKRSNGVGGLLLAVTEPHAAMVHELMAADDGSKYSILLNYTNMILEYDTRPRNWGVVERGRRSLWGGVATSNVANKNPDLEYNNLSSLVNYALRYGYAQLISGSGDAQAYANTFEGLCQYLNRSPPLSSAIFLRQIQSGVSFVLSDPDFHIRDYSGDRGKQNLLHSVCFINRITFIVSC
jgi:Rap1-interacting factor 1 N terminal